MHEHDTLFEQRARKAEELRALGIDPFANDFHVDCQVAEFSRRFAPLDADGLAAAKTPVALAGRVMAVNTFGKAAFLRIQDGSAGDAGADGAPVERLQLYVRQSNLTEADRVVFKKIDLGDIAGVVGTPMRTKTGELTLEVHQFRLLTKAMRPLPEKPRLMIDRSNLRPMMAVWTIPGRDAHPP